MKQCTKCKKEKTEDSFSFKVKTTGLRQMQCKECVRSLVKNHYNQNKEYYLNKAKKRNSEYKNLVNTYIYQYLLKNHCVDCGESDVTVLEFDHQGKKPKLQAVSQLVRRQYTFDKIVEEIEKCEVRCANCHRRKTAKDFKWYKLKMPL